MPHPPTDSASNRLDRELLRQTAAGDGVAFETFMTRHEAAVSRFSKTLVPEPAAAEDALQETFLTAWQRASTFRGEGSARSWLFTIARRSIYRSGRRQAQRAGADATSTEQLALAAGWGAAGDAERWASRLDDRLYLAQAMARLARGDREVLLLRDLEGFSTAEAAAVLGIDVTALKSRLHRARLRLTRVIRNEDGHAR